MAKSSIIVKQKKRGRPVTGVTPFVGIRLSEEILNGLDKIVNVDKASSRTEAIRQILTDYLKRRGFL